VSTDEWPGTTSAGRLSLLRGTLTAACDGTVLDGKTPRAF